MKEIIRFFRNCGTILSFVLLFAATKANAQTINVTGVVRDVESPLPGVTITAGAVQAASNQDGKFTINTVKEGELIFTYLGYETKRVSLASISPNSSGNYELNVVMESDDALLDEVIVVGFGTQKKVNLTGSVATVDAKELESRPVQNAAQALQGLVAGLNISASGNGGELNAGKSINVRGTGTIGQGSSGTPLVLIDGMDGDLSSLNPQDIESISVLKDAAASSIYGSRAPFGVILVTTKKGKTGPAQVNYNNNFRLSSPVLLPSMMNSYQFVNYFNDASINGGGGPVFSDHVVDRVNKYMNGELDPTDVVELGSGGKWNFDFTNGNVDWMKEYYLDNSFSNEHNLSVNGGSDKWKYYTSLNYLDQNGLMRYGQDVFDRYTGTVKLSGELSKFVSVDLSTRFIREDYSRATYMSDGFYDNVARRARPIRPIYDPNGYLMADVNYIDALENGGRREQQSDWLYQQVRTTITPLANWNIIGELNYRTQTNFVHEHGLRSYAYFADGVGKYQATTSIGSDYVYEYTYKANFFNPNIYTNYNTSFGVHNFAGILGFQSELNQYRDLSASRNDLISIDVPVIGKTTNETATVNGQYQNWATAGFFGRLNYDYDGRYLFEGNIRYDGTSRYRADQQWNWFPSFSAGWNIAREDFWQPIADKVSELKLRASYGQLGNQNTNSWYPTYQTIGTGTANGNWLVNGARPNTAGAPGLISSSLSWETIRSSNLGLDVRSLNNRLTGSFDIFQRFTENMVGPAPTLPVILGTAVPSTNNTDLKTTGWELSLGWRDNINEFAYGVRLNLSDSRTKILKYPNETQDIDKYMSNYYTNEIWGYQTIGIAKTQEEMDSHLATLPNGGQNALGSRWGAGDIMYADIDGDGQISGGSRTVGNSGDLSIIGNSTPRYSFGLDIDASWKGFDFRMFWQGVGKRDYYPGGLTFWGTTSAGQWWSTAYTEHLDYFRPDGHVLGANLEATYPRPIFGDKNQKVQTGYLQNAAYARLKNLQFGYTLPANVVNNLKISNVRFFVSGENLLTITSLAKSLDPESVGIGRQGGTVYPLMKVFSGGVSVNF